MLAQQPPIRTFTGKRLKARIAKHRDKFNGDGHLAGILAIGSFPGPRNRCPCNLPAIFGHLDRGATATSREHAILILAHRGHRVGEPNSRTN